VLTFTAYPQACGWQSNGDYKIGAPILHVFIGVGAPSITQTSYIPQECGAVVDGIPADAGVGPCAANASSSSSASTGTGATITTIDSMHVAGSFNFTPNGGTTVTGTFDVPFCSPMMGLQPRGCCLN
jgi:hypothetical protein